MRRNTDTGILDISQVPETIENFLSEDEKNEEIENAKNFFKNIYPEVNFKKLGPIEFSSKKGKSFDLVVKGPRGGETPLFLKDGSDIQQNALNRSFIKNSLGLCANKDISRRSEQIREDKNIE